MISSSARREIILNSTKRVVNYRLGFLSYHGNNVSKLSIVVYRGVSATKTALHLLHQAASVAGVSRHHARNNVRIEEQLVAV